PLDLARDAVGVALPHRVIVESEPFDRPGAMFLTVASAFSVSVTSEHPTSRRSRAHADDVVDSEPAEVPARDSPEVFTSPRVTTISGEMVPSSSTDPGGHRRGSSAA